jgi:hypothetical protein
MLKGYARIKGQHMMAADIPSRKAAQNENGTIGDNELR